MGADVENDCLDLRHMHGEAKELMTMLMHTSKNFLAWISTALKL